jgi:hypothetical protein
VPTIRTHDPRVGRAQRHLSFCRPRLLRRGVALRRRAHESPLRSSTRVAAAGRVGSAHPRRRGRGTRDVICAFVTPAVWKAFVADRLEQLHRECEKFGESGLVALTT